MSLVIIIILLWEVIRWVFTKRWNQGELVFHEWQEWRTIGDAGGSKTESSYVLRPPSGGISYYVMIGNKEGLWRGHVRCEELISTEPDLEKALAIEWTPGGIWRQNKQGRNVWYSRSIGASVKAMIKESLCDAKKALAAWVKEDC